MIQILFNIFLIDVAIHLGIFGFFLFMMLGIVFIMFTTYHLIMAMCKALGSIIGLFNLPRLEIGDSKPRLES